MTETTNLSSHCIRSCFHSQEVAASKEEEDDLSDKGSESDEAEGNKDSPSERDEESDKQSDNELDEIGGDDEEVRVISLC